MSDERPALAFELRTEGDPAALAASYMKHTDTLESDGEISESGDVPHAAAAASAASAVAPVVAEAVAAQAGAEDGGGEAAQMDAAGSDNELPVQDDSVHMHAEAESPDAEVASNVSFCDTSSDSSSSSDEDDGESGAKARPARERPVVADDEDEEIGEADMRTKNEIAKLPPVEPLSIEVPAGAVVSQIGAVSGVVDTLVIVKAMIGGEIEVLDQDSILLLEDRTPLGRVFDTFGPVSVPFYSVRFNSASEIKEKQIAVGMPVFFTKDLVKFVFTQPLRRIKGSDASNLYDEEVAEDQMEFSDDEQEAAFRRELKEKRKRKAGGQADRNRSGSDDDEGDEDGRSRGGRNAIRG
nr:hypothetical protein HK105_002374 [Polyrhizophydium stewartii]